MLRIRTIAFLFLTLAAVVALADGKPLTNADVVAMSKAQLDDDVVIAKIQQAATVDFDVSTEGLIALKQAGVSKAIMDAMLKKSQPSPSTSQKGATDPPPATTMIYVGGSGAAPYMGSVLDDITDYLGEKHVAAKQFPDADGQTRNQLVARLKESGGVGLLYFTLDSGQGQEDLAFKGIKLRVQCVNVDGQRLWEEGAEQAVWGTMDTAVKSLTKKMRKKLDPHIGKDGLPLQ